VIGGETLADRARHCGTADHGERAALAEVILYVNDYECAHGPTVSSGRFDFACANTSLHHMDFEAALTAMVRVLRPGGTLAVIGLAADGSFGDYLAGAPGLPIDRFYRAIHRTTGSGAPVKAADMTWAEVRATAARPPRDRRATAARLLPAARYRRHLLWRYSLLWTKP